MLYKYIQRKGEMQVVATYSPLLLTQFPAPAQRTLTKLRTAPILSDYLWWIISKYSVRPTDLPVSILAPVSHIRPHRTSNVYAVVADSCLQEVSPTAYRPVALSKKLNKIDHVLSRTSGEYTIHDGNGIVNCCISNCAMLHIRYVRLKHGFPMSVRHKIHRHLNMHLAILCDICKILC
jgi:hypothetical protein